MAAGELKPAPQQEVLPLYHGQLRIGRAVATVAVTASLIIMLSGWANEFSPAGWHRQTCLEPLVDLSSSPYCSRFGQTVEMVCLLLASLVFFTGWWRVSGELKDRNPGRQPTPTSDAIALAYGIGFGWQWLMILYWIGRADYDPSIGSYGQLWTGVLLLLPTRILGFAGILWLLRRYGAGPTLPAFALWCLFGDFLLLATLPSFASVLHVDAAALLLALCALCVPVTYLSWGSPA